MDYANLIIAVFGCGMTIYGPEKLNYRVIWLSNDDLFIMKTQWNEDLYNLKARFFDNQRWNDEF
jgi:hypothetical protein